MVRAIARSGQPQKAADERAGPPPRRNYFNKSDA